MSIVMKWKIMTSVVDLINKSVTSNDLQNNFFLVPRQVTYVLDESYWLQYLTF